MGAGRRVVLSSNSLHRETGCSTRRSFRRVGIAAYCVKAVSRGMVPVLLSLLFTATATAQSSQQSEDSIALKNDVQQLKTQQQLILDRLDELKKLMNSKRGDNSQLAIKLPDTMGVDGERFRGESTATVAIIEYGDIECPFCRRFKQDIYPRIFDDYIKTGKARFYYRDMPITFHEHALPAARAEHCAGEQGKFWEMHDSLFIDKPGLIGPVMVVN